MTPRPYQVRALDELWTWFDTEFNGNPIVEACVGAGKSPMIALMCQRALREYPQTRILVLTHQTELLLQNLDKIRRIWPEADVGVCSAELGKKVLDRQVTYATIGSVYRVAKKLGHVDLVFADECHMVPPEEKGMWRKTITTLKAINKNVRVIGWTGTPFRGNGIWLTAGKDPIFTHIATRVTMSELLGLGYLAPLVTEKTGINIDASQVGVSGDDYKLDELDAVMNQEGVIAQTCADIIQRTRDRSRILVYCVTIDHANNVQAKLAELGMDAEVVTSESPKAEKDRAISRFREGRLRCIVNVAMLTTGFDVPQVDCICLLRPTRSPVLYVQIGGRGMRVVGADIEESKAMGKSDCLWLDYTMTTVEQGPIDRVKGRKPRNSKPGEAPFKICDECGNSCALSAKVCPSCGFEFPVGPEVDPHGTKPSDAPILSKRREADGKKEWTVTDVTYNFHHKIGSTIPTMRVTYWAGDREIVSEWVALSHDGYGRMIAERWWKERSNIPHTPKSVQEAMDWIEYDGNILARPTKIKTMKDDKGYERIVEYQWGAGPAAGEGGSVEDQPPRVGGNGEVPSGGAGAAAVDPGGVPDVRLLRVGQEVPQVEGSAAS